jgi:glycosyltransferase involved in cell wall biosynthesis
MIALTCLLPLWGGDGADALDEAVASIAASTRRPEEILICQDGALPESLRAAVERAVRRLGARVVANARPRGLHHNLNHALTRVRTAWVARCDADDINAPDSVRGLRMVGYETDVQAR